MAHSATIASLDVSSMESSAKGLVDADPPILPVRQNQHAKRKNDIHQNNGMEVSFVFVCSSL